MWVHILASCLFPAIFQGSGELSRWRWEYRADAGNLLQEAAPCWPPFGKVKVRVFFLTWFYWNFSFFHELFVINSLFNFSTSKWWPSRFTPRFHHRKDVDLNLSNKAGLTALHLACQAGDTLLVCICHPKKEANSKELSSFCCKTEALPNEIFPITNNLDRVIFKIFIQLFIRQAGWMG